MTIKKINPEDLVKGKKYLVELQYDLTYNDKSARFLDIEGRVVIIEPTQPIYTIEQTSDTDLEMLVNVASGLHMTGVYDSYDECAKEALDLITACKQALKEVNND